LSLSEYAPGKHESSVIEYMKTYDLLSKDHPVIVGLLEMARGLDTEFMTTLAAQFQLTMRWLEAQKTINQGDAEDDDELLTANR